MLSSFRHFSLVSHDFSISCLSIYSSGSKLEMRERRLSLSHPENTKRRSKIITDRETSCESSSSLLPLSLFSIADSPRIAPWSLEPEGTIPALFWLSFHIRKGRKQQLDLCVSISDILYMLCWDWWPSYAKSMTEINCPFPTVPNKTLPTHHPQKRNTKPTKETSPNKWIHQREHQSSCDQCRTIQGCCT